jgi:hypothetical protein
MCVGMSGTISEILSQRDHGWVAERNIVERLILIFSMLVITSANAAPPSGYCEVTICNKISRFSLDPWAHIRDALGEVCMPATIEKKYAKEGERLHAESKIWQGESINITRESVTKVKKVNSCNPV